MYFENEKHRSRQRSNDEFFRRMNADELHLGATGSDIPTFCRTDIPRRDVSPRTSCNGTPNTPDTAPSDWYASCKMPSLAMVYAPVQAWQELLTPLDGLHQGSIFRELIKPLEVSPFGSDHHTEGGCCK